MERCFGKYSTFGQFTTIPSKRDSEHDGVHGTENCFVPPCNHKTFAYTNLSRDTMIDQCFVYKSLKTFAGGII